jgi:outer membrane receptor protein involved in Fe transport
MEKEKHGISFRLAGMCILFLALGTDLWSAASGKISGRVFDKASDAPLIGANVVLTGTTFGAVTDAEGAYVILNVPPGAYSARATLMGHATLVQTGVTVSVNQTTTLDFAMQQEAITGQTVTVTAVRPPVQLDVSSSQIIITAESIENRPVDNLEEILAAEAGIHLRASTDGTGLLVRGGDLNETDIMVDGLSTRNERTQQPVVALNLTAIKEIEILTGGFAAEYSDIRSGMISIVTNEGSLDRYSLNLDSRLSPAARKHFGPSPYGTDGPFWRVFAGQEAFTGVTDEMVNSGQYPFTFIGWNEVARQLLADSNPGNDMTPQEALEVWKWQHRIRKYADQPDVILDGSFSGHIPGTQVGFLASQRYENLQLAYPFSRNNSLASTSLLNLTSQLSDNIKVTFNNAFILQKGVAGTIYEGSTGMITGSRQGTGYARDAIGGDQSYRYMWNDASFNPIVSWQYRGGLTLNHVLSSKTYYDVRLEATQYRIKQEPIALRDTTGKKLIGGKWYDEGPWGYVGSKLGSITEKYDILNQFLMSGGGRGQDHSNYWGVSLTSNLVSQVNRHNEVKTGFNVDFTRFHERREINHGQTTQPFAEAPWNWWYWNESPVRAGAFLQDKLEYSGMIANLGIRADYMQPGTAPFNLDPAFIFSRLPYTLENFQSSGNSFSGLTTTKKAYKLYLSPRLGISHPVTASSKIFFNYAHLYQPPVTEQLYTVKPYSRSATVPNLAAEWPRTIQFEIGYEQSLGMDYLLHVMGYYKDVANELSVQNIVAIDAENDVSTWANNSYADIRGIELKMEKRTGTWWYGWVQAEYMVKSTGFTGLRYIYEDRQLANEERENTVQQKGYPVPSLTANLTFRTPADFGPAVMGLKPLAEWRLDIFQEWSAGGKELMNPEARLSEQHWADIVDWWNTDLRVEKRFPVAGSRIGFYMQVKNLFNFKESPSPLYWTRYVDSLHFPWETGSQHGNDKLGEYPTAKNGKDYIDLGWNTWTQFINPRDIYFGLRIQF